MTTYILVVEDDVACVDELRAVLANLPGSIDIRVATSRDEAFLALEDSFLDLVILDLNIPTASGFLDKHPEHGHAVFNRSRSAAPGTPIFVLTGSPAEDFLSDLVMMHQQQIDIWSEGRKTGTILFLKKYEIDKCPDVLAPIVSAVGSLADVELEMGSLDVSLEEDRLVRIFAKRFGGTRCVVSDLRAGLSGARIIRLRVTDYQGVLVHDAVAKFSTHAQVREEGQKYDTLVVRLHPSATPRKLATLEFGANKLAGIFFGLADGFDRSAFDIAGTDPAKAEPLIRNLREVTARWIHGVPETRRSIKEVRNRILDDEDLREIGIRFGLGWIDEFERREIQTRWGCGHGDLHGSNVLVSEDGVTLIDYGDVGDGPASMDPVTLELSLLFHPDSPKTNEVWPSPKAARSWGDMDVYLTECPFAEFVRECRYWAVEVAAGNREVAASAYAYLVRQLKYGDTDKEMVLALLDGVHSFYDAST